MTFHDQLVAELNERHIDAPLKWHNSSWHNDACGSAMFEIDNMKETYIQLHAFETPEDARAEGWSSTTPSPSWATSTTQPMWATTVTGASWRHLSPLTASSRSTTVSHGLHPDHEDAHRHGRMSRGVRLQTCVGGDRLRTPFQLAHPRRPWQREAYGGKYHLPAAGGHITTTGGVETMFQWVREKAHHARQLP